MTDKLIQLEENLRTLQSIKANYTLDDINSDKVDEWGLRYGLFESIQIIIDISCQIVAEKNLGTPKNFADCITLLMTNNFLTRVLGEKIIRMTGLRNLLVHEYGIIDVNKLYEYLNHLDDIKDFVYAIKAKS